MIDAIFREPHQTFVLISFYEPVMYRIHHPIFIISIILHLIIQIKLFKLVMSLKFAVRLSLIYLDNS